MTIIALLSASPAASALLVKESAGSARIHLSHALTKQLYPTLIGCFARLAAFFQATSNLFQSVKSAKRSKKRALRHTATGPRGHLHAQPGLALSTAARIYVHLRKGDPVEREGSRDPRQP